MSWDGVMNPLSRWAVKGLLLLASINMRAFRLSLDGSGARERPSGHREQSAFEGRANRGCSLGWPDHPTSLARKGLDAEDGAEAVG